jgi:hypothetical protein
MKKLGIVFLINRFYVYEHFDISFIFFWVELNLIWILQSVNDLFLEKDFLKNEMAKLTGPIWTRPNWSMRPNRLGRPGLGWVQPNPDPLCPPNLSLLSHVSVEHAAAPSSRFPFAPLMSPALSRPMWGAPTTAIGRRGCAPSCSTPLSSIWFPWPQMLAHDPPGSAAPLPFPGRLRLSPAPAIWGFAPPRYPLLPPPGGFDSCGSLVHPQPETLIGRRHGARAPAPPASSPWRTGPPLWAPQAPARLRPARRLWFFKWWCTGGVATDCVAVMMVNWWCGGYHILDAGRMVP